MTHSFATAAECKRFMQFSLVGAYGLAAQLAIVGLLAHALGLNYLAATAIGVEAAILVNYVGHERWTFRDRALGASGAWGAYGAIGRLIRFNALTAATSIGGSILITALLVESLGMPAVVANVISVAVLSVVNFVGASTLVFRTVAVGVMVGLSSQAFASEEAVLKPKTVKDFAKYVAAVEARRAKSIADNEPFLEFERRDAAEQARIMAMLRRGEVYVERGFARDAASNEISIDGGLVNHWRGTVFVPKVKLDAMLKVLQEPQSDKHKQEDVLSSRVVSRDGDSQKVFLRLRRTKFVTVVYDTEYDVDYKRVAPGRAFSNSISTKVVEIENAGTPKERALPEGNDSGYMWRLNSYWRYKEFEDGVLVEIESLTLSRNLPAIVGPLIRPIVNSTARESMTRTLASVRARFM
jgi:putative flippase GtrA